MGVLNLNYKGQTAIDLLFGIIFLISLAVGAATIFLLSGTFSDITDDDSWLSNQSKEVVQASQNVPSVYDYGFLFALVILWISMIIGSYNIDSNPGFFIITLFLLLGILFVGAITANVWGSVTEDSSLLSTTTSLPVINWVYDSPQFLIILVAMGLSSAIALFARPQ